MDDFLEFEKDIKAIKSINLDDFPRVDVVRLNFSHSEKEFHKQIIKNVRKISSIIIIFPCTTNQYAQCC